MARKRKAETKPPVVAEEPSPLAPLRERVEHSRQLADWMGAAMEHREEFPPQVVVTVMRDYLAQYDTVVDDLKSAATVASDRRKALAEQASGLEDAEKELEAAIDELKLRHVIGELNKDAFDEKEKEVRAAAQTTDLPKIREQIEEIDSSLAEVGAVQARIADMRREYEVMTGVQKAAPADVAPPPPADDELGDAAYAAGGPAAGQEWEVGTADNQPKIEVPIEEKPAAEKSDEAKPADAPSEPAADAAPAEEANKEPEAKADAKAEELMATGVISARPDIAAMDDPAPKAAEQLVAPQEAEGEGPRLLVIPPDAPEQVYPFTGEVMSMGRGRNNDIQIKNDGKISRYHCRIFRRGDEFIIEDNKSSNGTLVNGKLVTRQRLDGGEQVQIGETRMTFFL
ncbi:MAG: FHA domain-containing protein [Deltaproteobacteria bacterium]|nr:FHA domain-containing protein [Deltaproteobacteria bacterium]